MSNCRFCSKKLKNVIIEVGIWKKSRLLCPDKKCRGSTSQEERNCASDGSTIFKDPRGSSKWESFNYRAGYLMEKAKDERRNAEEVASGEKPYTDIDDVSSGEYFGEVK